jgi:hypothetical protein
MKVAVIALALLFCLAAVSAQRYYYFQTLSSPLFVEPPNHLEEPERNTRLIIFSIDTPLFRDEYFDDYADLNSAQTSDELPAIGWAGPIPNFLTDQTGGAESLCASVAVVVATVALLI